jgi:hypothetical protein
MPGISPHFEVEPTKAKHIPMRQLAVHASHPGYGATPPERPGVHVCVKGVDQLETQLFDAFEIPVDVLNHWVGDDRLSPFQVGEQVGVGTGLLVEEMLEQHGSLQ